MRRSANYISAQKPRIGSAQSFPVAARVPSRLPPPPPSRVRSETLASELEKWDWNQTIFYQICIEDTFIRCFFLLKKKKCNVQETKKLITLCGKKFFAYFYQISNIFLSVPIIELYSIHTALSALWFQIRPSYWAPEVTKFCKISVLAIASPSPNMANIRSSQMFQKVKYGLPAKIWGLLGCTKMISW